MSSSSSEEEQLLQLTPPEILNEAKIANESLIPEKSKEKYLAAYDSFLEWKTKKNTQSFSENVFLAYFSELGKKYKPSSLWCIYSMLRSIMKLKHSIDIKTYCSLMAFLKRQSDGYIGRKSSLSPADVEKFLKEAPDSQYLATKIFVTLSVCFNILGHGATVGFSAVLLPQLQALDSPIPLNTDQESWYTSILAIMMLIGNFVSMRLMDVYGRRLSHVVSSVPGIVGWIVTAAQPTGFAQLLIGKALTSLSMGLSLPIRSVIIGEYTSPKLRGACLTSVGLTYGLGIFLVHFIGTITGWQMTAWITTFFPLIGLVMTLFCPESPSFLASKGRFDECRKAFHWLRGDAENSELEELINARMKLNDEEKLNSISDVIEVIKKKEFYKPMITMGHAFAMLQFSGAPTLAAYSTVIITEIAGDVENVNFWMLEIDAERIFFSVIAVFIIHKFKRRLMLGLTGSLSVLSHVAIALYVSLKEIGLIDRNNTWIGLFLINVQFVSVAMGMTTLPNVFMGEVFPLRFRSTGNAVTNVTSSVCNFIILKSLPYLLGTIGITGLYYLYAGLLAYFITVLWLFLPETKDKTLQQIEDEYRGIYRKPKKDEKLECVTRF